MAKNQRKCFKISLFRSLRMWKKNKMDSINEKKNDLFEKLLYEVNCPYRGHGFSFDLRNDLEKFPFDVRKEIVNRLNEYSRSPLFIACRRGQHEMAEYLIHTCGADIEQKGSDNLTQEEMDFVTPLWCAVRYGKLSIVKLLFQSGADINAEFDTGHEVGYTPLMLACWMATHFEVVKYLIHCGADINKQNYKDRGQTCLMNSVESATICDILLKNGADVNVKDNDNETALLYAIEERQLETIKLLLEHGADYTVKSRFGHDILQTACLIRDNEMVEYLISNINYSPERIANTLELLGALLMENYDSDSTASLNFWKRALKIRDENDLHPKQPVMPLQESYQKQRESETLDELIAMSRDLDKMRTESLLILERIMGSHFIINSLWEIGWYYYELMRYQRCIEVWHRALQIITEEDTILNRFHSLIAQSLVKMMQIFNIESIQNNFNNTEQRFHNIMETFKVLTQNFEEIGPTLLIMPHCEQQFDVSEKIFSCIPHLIYLLIDTAKTKNNKELVTKLLPRVINFKSFLTGDSILHNMCMSPMNTIEVGLLSVKIEVFSDLNVLKQLLECGANVHAKNKRGQTPLHTAADSHSTDLVKLLLDSGAHIDESDDDGNTPLEYLFKYDDDASMFEINYTTLQCLCAREILINNIPYVGQLPKPLESFVKLHDRKCT